VAVVRGAPGQRDDRRRQHERGQPRHRVSISPLPVAAHRQESATHRDLSGGCCEHQVGRGPSENAWGPMRMICHRMRKADGILLCVSAALGGGVEVRRSGDRSVSRAARGVVMLWLFWVILLGLSVIGWSGLAAWLVIHRSPLAVPCLLFAGACVAALLRLWPLRPLHSTALPAGTADTSGVAAWVRVHGGGWSPRMRLVPEPGVWMDGDELMLGLPLMLCLRDSELSAVLADAQAQQVADSASPAIAWTVRLARGRVGRTLVLRKKPDPTWVDRKVFGPLRRRLERFAVLRSEATEGRRAGYDESWGGVAARAQNVDEAWNFVVHRWLAPAWERGVWYEEPFSALRLFLDSCAVAGPSEEFTRLPGGEVHLNLSDAEHELARRMVGEAVADHQGPSQWDDHPGAVDLPRWREELARGLRAASAVAGRPVRASIVGLLDVAVNAEVAFAAALAPAGARGASDDEPDKSVIDELLACAAAVALVDSGHARLTWEWPAGATLRDEEGRIFELGSVVTDRTRLPSWLKEQGVDPDAPLWLGVDPPPSRELPLYAFNAAVNGSRRRVVLSDQGVYIFDKPASLLSGLGSLLRPPEDRAGWDVGWAAVASGQIPHGVLRISWSEVADVKLVPTLRDTERWRLKLRTSAGAVVIRGSGIVRIERLVGSLVGSRYRRVGPPRLKGFRWDFLRLAAVCVGGMTFLLGATILVNPHASASTFAGCSIAAIGLSMATLPLSLRSLRVWRSERRARLETQPFGLG
jgi:hypothetical protein